MEVDELLLKRAAGGDPEAFERLMSPLENRVWRVCWHYMGERESAEDCGQETMLRVWRSLGGYRGDCAFETWVCRIAANCCLDELRRRKRDRSVALEPLQEAGFDPADPRPGVEEAVLAAERKQQLRQAIARLPEEQRSALVLTQLEGLPYERAAQLLGVSEGTVKSRVNRARQKLKAELNGERELSPAEFVRKHEGRVRS